jgi:hypothetical protein
VSDEVMGEIMRSLGRIEQKIDGHTIWMTQHVADDKLMAADIQKLQLGASRLRGVITALSAVGTVLGAGVGYAIDAFTLRGHH